MIIANKTNFFAVITVSHLGAPWHRSLNSSDYIHYNPVAHGLCRVPQEWQFSSLHRLIAMGVYKANWGMDEWVVEVPSWGAGE